MVDEFTLTVLGENSQDRRIVTQRIGESLQGIPLARNNWSQVAFFEECGRKGGVMVTEQRPEKTNLQVVPRIEFRDVSLAFDDQVVLAHVSFTVAPGEMKLMLGESGGGKSMLIKLALGLERPDSGEIF